MKGEDPWLMEIEIFSLKPAKADRGHHSRFSQNICQLVVRMKPSQYVLCSIYYSTVKSNHCCHWTGEKSHFQNKDTVWWCTLHVGNFFATVMQPFCVVVSKEQANFKCGQRIIMEEVSVTSDSYSMEQQLSLSLCLTFLDLPVFSVQYNLSSWMRYLLQVLWKSDYYKYWCLKKFIWQEV